MQFRIKSLLFICPFWTFLFLLMKVFESVTIQGLQIECLLSLITSVVLQSRCLYQLVLIFKLWRYLRAIQYRSWSGPLLLRHHYLYMLSVSGVVHIIDDGIGEYSVQSLAIRVKCIFQLHYNSSWIYPFLGHIHIITISYDWWTVVFVVDRVTLSRIDLI